MDNKKLSMQRIHVFIALAASFLGALLGGALRPAHTPCQWGMSVDSDITLPEVNCSNPPPTNFTCVSVPSTFLCRPLYDIVACASKMDPPNPRQYMTMLASQVDTTVCLKYIYFTIDDPPVLCGSSYQKIGAAWNAIQETLPPKSPP